VGGAAFIALMVGAASISDAVSEADGINGLDKPVLDLAISVRTPTLDLWVTAFTNLGRTLPMVLVAGMLTLSLPAAPPQDDLGADGRGRRRIGGVHPRGKGPRGKEPSRCWSSPCRRMRTTSPSRPATP
jgi:hypothetical protein